MVLVASLGSAVSAAVSEEIFLSSTALELACSPSAAAADVGAAAAVVLSVKVDPGVVGAVFAATLDDWLSSSFLDLVSNISSVAGCAVYSSW